MTAREVAWEAMTLPRAFDCSRRTARFRARAAALEAQPTPPGPIAAMARFPDWARRLPRHLQPQHPDRPWLLVDGLLTWEWARRRGQRTVRIIPTLPARRVSVALLWPSGDAAVCAYCGRLLTRTIPADLTARSVWRQVTRPTVDHVIPLAQGGAPTLDNCTLACYACNQAKRDTLWVPQFGPHAAASG